MKKISANENFFERVYMLIEKIPYGKVTTYGAIAESLGAKSSARMVGWAINADKGNRNMPYHRVVNRFGALSGSKFFKSPTMRELLESEGVEFINELVDMEKYFWKP